MSGKKIQKDRLNELGDIIKVENENNSYGKGEIDEQKTIKSVERRMLKTMMADEKESRVLLETEANDVPERQLDGLMVKIEQFLGRIMVNQNKLMLLQDLV